MPEEIRRAAIYMRVSTKMQTEKYSLGSQKRILTELCDNNGWEYTIYEDAGISGKNIADRPAMKRLLEDADDDKFQAIAIIEWERLSRDIDLFDFNYIKKVFRDNNIKIVTPSQTYDLSDDEDDFISDLMGILSKREKKKIIKRMMRGKVEAVRKGIYPGGLPPYGYRHNKETSRLEIDEDQAEVIRLIFHLCNVENLSTEKIADVLNKRGVPPYREFGRRAYPNKNPNVKGFHSGTIKDMLRNPVYCGKFAYMKKKGDRERRKEEEWVYGSNPAIVSEKEFKLAGKRLTDRQIFSPRNKKYDYLLSGKLQCGDCSSKMHGITYKYQSVKKGKPNGISIYPYYKCRSTYCDMGYIKIKVVDDLVWELVSVAIKNPDIIKASLLANLDEPSTEIDISMIEKQVQENKAQEQMMLSAFTSGAITMQQLKDQNAKLLEERERMELQISENREKMQEQVDIETQFERAEDLIAVVQDSIDDLDYERKKLIIELIIEKIAIHKEGDVDIYCCIPIIDLDKLQEVMESDDFPMLSSARRFQHLLFKFGQLI